MEQESQMIQGTVLAVIYQNPENGYCVLKVRTEQGETVTVVGTIPMSVCLLYTSPSPRDRQKSRMPSSA